MRKLFGVLTAGTALLAVTACESELTDRDKSLHINIIATEYLPDLFFASRIDYDAWSQGIELPSEVEGVNITYELGGSLDYLEGHEFLLENNKLYYAIKSMDSDPSSVGSYDESMYFGIKATFEYQGYERWFGYDYNDFAGKKMSADDYNDIPKFVESITPSYDELNEPYLSIIPDIDSGNGWRITDYTMQEYSCNTDGPVTEGLEDGKEFKYYDICSYVVPNEVNHLHVAYTIERYHPAKPEIYKVYGEIKDRPSYNEFHTPEYIWPEYNEIVRIKA